MAGVFVASSTLAQAPISRKAKTSLKLSFEGGRVSTGGVAPFFIPQFNAEGKAAGGFQTDIRSANFDVAAVASELESLLLAVLRTDQSSVTVEVRVDTRKLKTFYVSEDYILVPSDVADTATGGPFASLRLSNPDGSKALEGSTITLEQKGRLATGRLSVSAVVDLRSVAREPMNVTVKASSASGSREFRFVPVLRGAVRGAVTYSVRLE